MRYSPTGSTFAALAIVGIGLLSTPAPAQPAFTDAQRDAIREILREQLIRNPEILQEAMIELEKRQAETLRRTQQAALSEARQTLTNSVHGYTFGNPAGDVTLVEFFDYNCGYCKKALADLRVLIKGDSKLRVVLKDMPVLGPDSVEATRVSLAAKQQLAGDKLFEFHGRLIESRGRIGRDRALAVAREMGLDLARLERDIAGPQVAAAMAENADLAEKLALTGTPAFVVGNEVISGAVGVEPLKLAVSSTRKCGNAVC